MKKIKVVWCAVSIAVMALIFFFSHQTAEVSTDTSGGFAQALADCLGAIFKGEANDRILWLSQWIVRKSAHLFLFAVLGVCVYNSWNFGTKKSRVIITLLICVLYTISDEIHQSFIPGRAGRVSDVFIDSIGSLTGIFITVIVTRKIVH